MAARKIDMRVYEKAEVPKCTATFAGQQCQLGDKHRNSRAEVTKHAALVPANDLLFPSTQTIVRWSDHDLIG